MLFTCRLCPSQNRCWFHVQWVIRSELAYVMHTWQIDIIDDDDDEVIVEGVTWWLLYLCRWVSWRLRWRTRTVQSSSSKLSCCMLTNKYVSWKMNIHSCHLRYQLVTYNYTRIPVSAMSDRTHLRSAVHCDLVVPRTRLARYGPRGFAVSGLATWNSLPPDIRDMSLSAVSCFNQLKTELFIRAYYMRWPEW